MINKISLASNERGDLLLDFMDKYNIDSLNAATLEQLSQYISEGNIG